MSNSDKARHPSSQMLNEPNALLPILRLPDEILLKIAQEYKFSRPSSGRGYADWLTITHISHQWREVALGYPPLWNTFTVPQIPLPWLSEYIRRSRSSPLDITVLYYTSQPEYWQAAIPMLSEVLDRVEGLTLNGLRGLFNSSRWDSHDWLDFSSSPLRRLRTWDCSALYKHWKPSYSVQHLQIERSHFHSGYITPTLTMLKLMDLDSESIPSLPDFYALLSDLTNLHHLSLTGVLSKSAARTANSITLPLPNIFLPSLHTLHLNADDGKECHSFLSHLACPHLDQLVVDTDMQHTAPPSPLSYLGEVTTKINSSTSIFGLFLSPVLRLHLSLGRYRNVTVSEGDRLLFHLSFTFGPTDMGVDYMEPYYRLVANIPLDKIRSLSISWDDPATDKPVTIASLFSKSPAIDTLRVRAALPEIMLVGLTPSCNCVQRVDTRSFNRDSTSKTLPASIPACTSCQDFAASMFPSLRILSCHVHQLGGSGDPAVLRKFLAYRSDCGRPLEEVVIWPGTHDKESEDESVLELLRSMGDVIRCPFFDDESSSESSDEAAGEDEATHPP